MWLAPFCPVSDSERHGQQLVMGHGVKSSLTRSDEICRPLVSMILTVTPILAASSDMAVCSRSRSTWPGMGG